MKVIFIYGPSMTEKTTLAVKISQYLWGKYSLDSILISADSRKVYKGMNVVQSYIYPSVKEKLDIRLINFLPLDKEFTLELFLKYAREYIAEAHAKGKVPIVFGGNGIYIKSLIEGWIPSENETKRTKEAPEFDSILLSPQVDKERLLKTMDWWAKQLVKKGLISEYYRLLEECNSKPGSFCALKKTLGYKQVYEAMARFGGRNIDDAKFRAYLAKELRIFVKKQIKFYSNLPKPTFITLENYKEVIDRIFS